MSATLEVASRMVWLSEQPHLGPTLLRGFKGTVTAHGISSGWRKGSGQAAQGSFPVTLPSLGPRTLPGGLWGHLSTPGGNTIISPNGNRLLAFLSLRTLFARSHF